MAPGERGKRREQRHRQEAQVWVRQEEVIPWSHQQPDHLSLSAQVPRSSTPSPPTLSPELLDTTLPTERGGGDRLT